MAHLEKIRDLVIYKDDQYNSFPDAIRLADGRIVLSFRQAPNWQDRSEKGLHRCFKITHCDPSSRAMFVTSMDDGQSFDTKANILYDDFLYGVQDPCMLALRDGTILSTFFMWKMFYKDDIEDNAPGENRHFVYDYIAKNAGAFTIRSVDGGKNWDQPIPVAANDGVVLAVRGKSVELPDGVILTAFYGKRAGRENPSCFILETADQGRTWRERAECRTEEPYDLAEPSLFRTDSGKLVLFIRAQLRSGANVYAAEHNQSTPLFTSESTDDGFTWSTPQSHAMYSPSPFQPLRLQSGRVLVTYGHRYPPYGVKAFLLGAECTDFDTAEVCTLRDDGLGGDIGYTTAVQLLNSDILVAYYYYGEDGFRHIAGTICREAD